MDDQRRRTANVVEIYAGTEPLVGWLPNAVTGDGVWQSPVMPAVVQLRSAYVANVIGSLTAFTQEQVTDIGMQVYREDTRNAFSESERVNGQTARPGRPVPAVAA